MWTSQDLNLESPITMHLPFWPTRGLLTITGALEWHCGPTPGVVSSARVPFSRLEAHV